jgi:hypothetical protein
MKRRLAFAIVLGTFLAACSANDQRPASAGVQGKPATQGFRTPGAPAEPESYEQGKAKAALEAKAGDTYVHAHLDMGWLDHCLTNGQLTDWATTYAGACYGSFKGGSEPFTGGRAAWSSWTKTDNNTRILIGMATMRNTDDPSLSNVGISCYIKDRSSGDCYTNNGSHLQLTAVSGDYILLRGMCRDGDPMCKPTRSPTLEGSRPEDAKPRNP